VTTSTPESRYFHGSAPGEHYRLGLLNEILNDSSLREIALRSSTRPRRRLRNSSG
jgi:hypothetical protein